MENFNEIVNESGVIVKELKLSSSMWLRTCGNNTGLYIYNPITNQYSNTILNII